MMSVKRSSVREICRSIKCAGAWARMGSVFLMLLVVRQTVGHRACRGNDCQARTHGGMPGSRWRRLVAGDPEDSELEETQLTSKGASSPALASRGDAGPASFAGPRVKFILGSSSSSESSLHENTCQRQSSLSVGSTNEEKARLLITTDNGTGVEASPSPPDLNLRESASESSPAVLWPSSSDSWNLRPPERGDQGPAETDRPGSQNGYEEEDSSFFPSISSLGSLDDESSFSSGGQSAGADFGEFYRADIPVRNSVGRAPQNLQPVTLILAQDETGGNTKLYQCCFSTIAAASRLTWAVACLVTVAVFLTFLFCLLLTRA